MENLIILKDVKKVYGTKKNPIVAAGPVSFEIEKNSFTVIVGKSGSGKSTLLNLMAGLDKASEGEVYVEGKNLSHLGSSNLAKYRSSIGIIFQFYNLLPSLNAIENVMMGAWVGGQKVEEEKALDLMEKFGIKHRAKADVKTLSGGEKQRTAICRSLIGNPNILFCDEPTGALDSTNEEQVMEILSDLHKNGLTIVLVTHAPEFVKYADKVIYMKDGEVEKIEDKYMESVLIK